MNAKLASKSNDKRSNTAEGRPPQGPKQPTQTVPVTGTGPLPAAKKPKGPTPAKKNLAKAGVAKQVGPVLDLQAAPQPTVTKPAGPVPVTAPASAAKKPKRPPRAKKPRKSRCSEAGPHGPRQASASAAGPKETERHAVRSRAQAQIPRQSTPPAASRHPEESELRPLIASVIDPAAAEVSRPTANDANPDLSPQHQHPVAGPMPASSPQPTVKDNSAKDKAILNGSLFASRLKESLAGTADVSFEACCEHAQKIRSEQFFPNDRGERNLLEQIEFVSQKCGSMHAFAGSLRESDKEQLPILAAACRLSRELASLYEGLAKHRKSRMDFEEFITRKRAGKKRD